MQGVGSAGVFRIRESLVGCRGWSAGTERSRKRQEDHRTPLPRGPFTLQAVVPAREVWGASGTDEQAGPEKDGQTDRQTHGWPGVGGGGEGWAAAEIAAMRVQSHWSQGQKPRQGGWGRTREEGGCLGGGCAETPAPGGGLTGERAEPRTSRPWWGKESKDAATAQVMRCLVLSKLD